MMRRRAWILLLVLCLLAGCDRSYRSGDRVLVAKFLYETKLAEPRRFDVVVFKFPETPTKGGSARNYIKRLLGLPGEILAIFFGQLFRLPPPPAGSAPYFDDLANLTDEQAEVLAKRLWIKRTEFQDQNDLRWYRNVDLSDQEKKILASINLLPKDFPPFDKLQDEQARILINQLTEPHKELLTRQLWIKQLIGLSEDDKHILNHLKRGYLDFTHEDHPSSRQRFQKGEFEPVRKPPAVMLAMRRIVFDNDHQPEDLANMGLERWPLDPAGGWVKDDLGFRHPGGAKEEWLHYRHLVVARSVPGALPKDLSPQLIKDAMDYNSGDLRNDHPDNEKEGTAQNWVGDLMLECKLTVTEPNGEFALRLTRGIYQYQARWDLAKGECKLLKRGMGKKWHELASKTTAVNKTGSYQLRFANFDARLTVWVDGSLPFGDGFDYTPPELPTDEEKKDKKLKEDDFLKNLALRCGPSDWDLKEPASFGTQGAAVQVHHLKLWRDTYYTLEGKLDGPDPKDLKFKTLYVQPKHYLVLGDNSSSSLDSRTWGVVPERLLLGRALMVYFPFDRAGRIR